MLIPIQKNLLTRVTVEVKVPYYAHAFGKTFAILEDGTFLSFLHFKSMQQLNKIDREDPSYPRMVADALEADPITEQEYANRLHAVITAGFEIPNNLNDDINLNHAVI